MTQIIPVNEGSTVEEHHVDRTLLYDLIVGWAAMLRGDMTDEGLLAFLDELDAALDDPEQAALLGEYGITQETVDGLRDGINGEGEFDTEAWYTLFNSLSEMVGGSDFGITDNLILNFTDYALAKVSEEIDNIQDEEAKQIALLAMIDDLLASGGVLTEDMINTIIDAGITSDDVSNQKLKDILDDDDPVAAATGVNFTNEELEEIADELTSFADTSMEALNTETLLQLQVLLNMQAELVQLKSQMEKSEHDTKSSMAANIGQS